MLPPDAESRREGIRADQPGAERTGELSAEDRKRMSEMARLFGLDGGRTRTFVKVRQRTTSKSLLMRRLTADD